MTVIAQAGSGQALRARDLGERASVPAAYVSKVLRQLTRAGLLASRRGHHGGFQLARDPKTVCIAEILIAVNAHPDVGNCAFGWDSCDPDNPCALHDVWSDLAQRVTSWADSTTLEEVVRGADGPSMPAR